MNLFIKHITEYRYEGTEIKGYQQVRLRPAETLFQKIKTWNLEIQGGQNTLTYVDHFGNTTHFIELKDFSDSVRLIVETEIDLSDNAGILGKTNESMPKWIFQNHSDLTYSGAEIRKLAKNQFPKDPLDFCHHLNSKIKNEFSYDKSISTVDWTAEDCARARAGVCQDFSHVFISTARWRGLAARYVSGYLKMDSTDQSAMHAWAEVFIDKLGWVGFDPTNGICPDDRYVRVAVGRDYTDAAPCKGITQSIDGAETLRVQIQVTQQ